VNGAGKKKCDLAQEQLQKGFCWCDQWCDVQQYWDAQKQAQSDSRAWWSIEHADTADAGDAAVTCTTGDAFKAKVTHINAIDDFYLVKQDNKQSQIQQLIDTKHKDFELVFFLDFRSWNCSYYNTCLPDELSPTS